MDTKKQPFFLPKCTVKRHQKPQNHIHFDEKFCISLSKWSVRVKKLENFCSCRRSDISTRDILIAMEVAKMLKVSRVTVYRMAKRGGIPYYRNGSIMMFYKDEILRWVDSTRIK